MSKYREFILSTGIKIFLGKSAENNDELMKEFKGSEKKILHTVAPGSPFCVISPEEDKLPTQKEIQEAGVVCAAKSQDWRDNKKDVELHLFLGKEVKKPILAKSGTWKITSKPKVIKVKKSDILKFENGKKNK